MKRVKKNNLIMIIILVFIMCTTILAIYFLLNKDVVKKELQGVVIHKETGEVLDHVTLIIDGKIREGINTSVFLLDGQFSLSNLEYTKDNMAFLYYDTVDKSSKKTYRNRLTYPVNIWRDGVLTPDFAIFYKVEIGDDFSYVVLGDYEDDYITYGEERTERVYNGTDLMVFPAYDTESALQVIKDNGISNEIFDITTKEDYHFVE